MKQIIHSSFFNTKDKRYAFTILLCLFYLILACFFAFYSDRISLAIVTLLNGLFLFFSDIYTYEITSEEFIWYHVGGFRKKKIHLSTIERVEARYTKQGKIKELVIRFFNGEYRNFTIVKGGCGEEVLIALKKVKPELEVLTLDAPTVRRR